MISVTSADDSITASTIAMRSLLNVSPTVSGFSTRCRMGRPTKIIRSTNITDSATIASSISTAPPAVVIATTNARRLHAVTSSTAAHVMAVVPNGVCVRWRSSRMRASTGKAVMLMAMPQNSAKAWNGTPGGAYRV